MNKYRAKPTIAHGIRFHSRKEAERYIQLRLLEHAGKIHDLTLQPAFELHAPAGNFVKKVGKYIADFQYQEPGRKLPTVEDVKGMKTPLYNWKKKHFLIEYGDTCFFLES